MGCLGVVCFVGCVWVGCGVYGWGVVCLGVSEAISGKSVVTHFKKRLKASKTAHNAQIKQSPPPPKQEAVSANFLGTSPKVVDFILLISSC